MHELTETIESWRARGDAVATATLVAVRGSAPCPIGAKMAVNQRGDGTGAKTIAAGAAVPAPLITGINSSGATFVEVIDPALILTLGSQARYVGALGSRKTHALRIERLKRAGLTGAQMARLRAPIGLDIGARTPSEIALAIAAEMAASREAATLPS